MNEIKIFENAEFGKVRTLMKDSEPWFVAKDVCECLDINNSRQALTRLDDDEKADVILNDGSQNRKFATVNEYGLYNLVLSSRKPEAKAFKRWITHDVIPSIRKTGSYSVKLSPAEEMARGLLAAQKMLEEKDAKIKELTPKGIFADAVSASETCILIGDLAKLLKQNGIETGQKRLFKWMRENGYLIKQKGHSYNLPTQRSMNAGWFEIKETTINNPDGSIRVTKTTKVTGKGQVYFVNLFIKMNEKANDEAKEGA